MPSGSIIGNTLINANPIVNLTESTATVCGNRATADGAFNEPTVSAADVKVELNAPTAVRIGSTYTYTVTVTNTSPVAAVNVVTTLDVSGGKILGILPSPHFQTDKRVVWRLASLGSGGVKRFELTLAAPLLPNTVTAAAKVTSETADPDANNNHATINTQIRLI